jgi:SSS family solute:Na+ symporter
VTTSAPARLTMVRMLRLQLSALDYAILAVYFLVVLGIGAVARLSVKTDVDFFLSGRRLPAWITGLAFIAANLGALEVLGQAANGAQYGVAAVHYYWIGAVPAMIFLGLVMMPFYYGAKVRSVPEYLRLRFNEPTHAFNAITFAVATVLISGVNLFALALIVHLMLGWSIAVAILVAAAVVMAYVTLGGLTSAIYNEVLQFFVIVASLLPLTLVGLHSVGGIDGLKEKVRAYKPLGEPGLHAWQGLGIGHVTNPLASNWIGVVFGLGFVLSFGYWTTNFPEVQRALSARNLSAARRTPLIGAYPKIFLPLIIILPGLIAVVTVPGLGGSAVGLQYNTAIPHLIGNLLPEGMLGIAVTGLLAAFMAGVAANVTAFNTVVTYDLIQSYVVKDRDDRFYLRTGRWVTVGGVLVSIGTAFIAKGYSNIMNYIQTLFSIFNAPLFATFIIAMFWRRATPWGGFWSLVAGTGAAYAVNRLNAYNAIFHFGSALSASFWQAIIAFLADAVVLVAVSLVTRPKPQESLRGLVWGLTRQAEPEADADPRDQLWWRSPILLGGVAIAMLIVLNIVFI